MRREKPRNSILTHCDEIENNSQVPRDIRETAKKYSGSGAKKLSSIQARSLVSWFAFQEDPRKSSHLFGSRWKRLSCRWSENRRYSRMVLDRIACGLYKNVVHTQLAGERTRRLNRIRTIIILRLR